MNVPICAASPRAAAAQTQSPAGQRSSHERPTRSPAASPPNPRDEAQPVISRRPSAVPPHNYLSATPPAAPLRLPGEFRPALARGLRAPGDTPRAPRSGSLSISAGGGRGCIRVSRLAASRPVDHDVSLFAFDIETSPRPAPPPVLLPTPHSGRLSSHDLVGAWSGAGPMGEGC